MRFRTLEIRWHDSKPISTCDFQPVPFKKARPAAGQDKNYAGQAYRLATGGEDNHVRLWMVHPHIRPASLVDEADQSNGQRPPRVEYLATLSRHSAAVNVVRFSPNGDCIASAGDDGMIIIWAPSSTPQTTTYGSDLSAEDLQHEKEYWKPRTSFRCTTMQVYDLAWSPTGEYIIAGSTDNTARVFAATDGKCVCEIAEHSHFVQGVAWDPLNEYIATQSSDRSMHIYRISTKNGTFEAHAVGKNTRMPHHHRRHSRTPSVTGRQRMFPHHADASASDSESAIVDDSNDITPLTPAMSVASTPSAAMFPPPPIEASSRRSSFSGSNAPGSPSTFGRYGRSPSPMPPLPAIRSLPPNSWASVKLYGDESFTNFFRRLTFSPDGGLLLTPAGQFEDTTVFPGSRPSTGEVGTPPARGRKGRPASVSDGGVLPSASNPAAAAAASSSTSCALPSSSSSSSSVFIYSRANFARPPIAQLPGHKKASVAVRFSPILYELRPGVEGAEVSETKTAALERGLEGSMQVDVTGPVPLAHSQHPSSSVASSFDPTPTGAGGMGNTLLTPQRTPQTLPMSIDAPAPRLAISTSNIGGGSSSGNVKASPALSPMDLRPPTPAASKPSTPVPFANANGQHQHQQGQQQDYSTPQHPASQCTPKALPAPGIGTGSIFALPYRMLYAVVTMDTIAVYDTQQSGPVALLTKLHYDEFTDMTWSPDGQCLILSSRDGYCTIIIFDEILAAHHTQQHTLQMQSIAYHHSVPLITPQAISSSNSASGGGSGSGNNSGGGLGLGAGTSTPAATPSSAHIALPNTTGVAGPFGTPHNPKKRAEPPLTPAGSVDGEQAQGSSATAAAGSGGAVAVTASGSILVAGDGNGGGNGKQVDVDAEVHEPPKKKRRVQLTRVGDLDA